MEYGACQACNDATRGADAVAAMVARILPYEDSQGWQTTEMLRLLSAVDRHAPGVRAELSDPWKTRHGWSRRPGSTLLQKVTHVQADGPLLHANLSVFGAKLAMALYREHVGAPLPLSGAVWTQFALNNGMTQDMLEDRVKILPMWETLRQGRKTVDGQFGYRFNCDDRTVIAAVAQFHRGLWITLFASWDERIVALFEQPEFRLLPASALVRPGGLLRLLPGTTPIAGGASGT